MPSGVGAPYQPPSTHHAGGAGGQFQVHTSPNGTQFIGPLRQGRLAFSAATGLQLNIGVSPTFQYGYQPIVLTATSQRPRNAARTIRVRFAAGAWYNDGRGISVTQAFQLPKGKTASKTTLLVPQYQDWQLCSWDVEVDGRRDDELSLDDASVPQQSMNFGVAALVVAPAAGLGQPQWDIQNALTLLGNGAAGVRWAVPDDLSANWVEYSTLDYVVLRADQVSGLAASHRPQLGALLRWVRTGGNLWLIACGPEWSQLADAEKALGLGQQASATDPARADADVIARGWRFVPLGDRALEPIEGALALSDFDVVTTVADPTPNAPRVRSRRRTPTNLPPQTSQPWFAIRGHGLGTITAFRGDFSASAANASITAVQSSLLMPRSTSAARHGNQPGDPNPDFNNWLIPGVGVAPIGQFQLLISLFVLGIGPLNYWWLKRKKKLPLLLATVPTSAALVTLLLLAYGVFADGLGIRARVRSLTLLDQREGEASSWSRICYYAGINPRQGLAIPRDAVLYPIDSRWGARGYRRAASMRREIEWSDLQRLTRGWLPSRTPTQFLSVVARRTHRKIELRATADGLVAVNRLGAKVTHLAVCDREGRLYWCENLAADAGTLAPAADPIDVSGKLRTLFSDHYPEFPPGADSMRYGGGYYGPTLSLNLMEAQLEAINSPMVRGWAPGSYVAVTDRGVELSLGVDAQEEASFHVICGRW